MGSSLQTSAALGQGKDKVFLSMLRLNESCVLADLVPNGSVGMLAGMQHGDNGATHALRGHWAVVSKRLGWEGSSLQSKLQAPEVRVEVV